MKICVFFGVFCSFLEFFVQNNVFLCVFCSFLEFLFKIANRPQHAKFPEFCQNMCFLEFFAHFLEFFVQNQNRPSMLNFRNFAKTCVLGGFFVQKPKSRSKQYCFEKKMEKQKSKKGVQRENALKTF